MFKLLCFVLFASFVYGAECHLSTVEYQDAKVIANPDFDTDLLPTKIAFGCVYPDKGTLVVIQNFLGEQPLNIFVIPIGAVVKITGLKDDISNVPAPMPNILPNAKPDSIDKGVRPNDKRLM